MSKHGVQAMDLEEVQDVVEEEARLRAHGQAFLVCGAERAGRVVLAPRSWKVKSIQEVDRFINETFLRMV
jgi:hypothetical protein